MGQTALSGQNNYEATISKLNKWIDDQEEKFNKIVNTHNVNNDDEDDDDDIDDIDEDDDDNSLKLKKLEKLLQEMESHEHFIRTSLNNKNERKKKQQNEELKLKYENLKVKVKNQFDEVNKKLNLIKEFHKQTDELAKWINVMKENVYKCSVVNDKKDILDEKLKEIEGHKQHGEESLDNIKLILSEIYDEDVSTEEKDVLTQKYNTLKREFDQLNQTISKKLAKLDSNMQKCILYDEQTEKCLSWLNHIRDALSKFKEPQTNLDSKLSKLEEFQQIHLQQVFEYQTEFDKLNYFGQRLIESNPDSSVSSSLTKISKSYNEILSNAKDLLHKLETCYQEHHQQHIILGECSDYIESMKLKICELKKYLSLTDDSDELKSKFNLIKLLIRNLEQNKENKVHYLEELTRKVIKNTSQNGISSIQESFDNVKKEFNHLFDELEKVKFDFEFKIDRNIEFEKLWKDFNIWMENEIEKKLELISDDDEESSSEEEEENQVEDDENGNENGNENGDENGDEDEEEAEDEEEEESDEIDDKNFVNEKRKQYDSLKRKKLKLENLKRIERSINSKDDLVLKLNDFRENCPLVAKILDGKYFLIVKSVIKRINQLEGEVTSKEKFLTGLSSIEDWMNELKLTIRKCDEELRDKNSILIKLNKIKAIKPQFDEESNKVNCFVKSLRNLKLNRNDEYHLKKIKEKFEYLKKSRNEIEKRLDECVLVWNEHLCLFNPLNDWNCQFEKRINEDAKSKNDLKKIDVFEVFLKEAELKKRAFDELELNMKKLIKLSKLSSIPESAELISKYNNLKTNLSDKIQKIKNFTAKISIKKELNAHKEKYKIWKAKFLIAIKKIREKDLDNQMREFKLLQLNELPIGEQLMKTIYESGEKYCNSSNDNKEDIIKMQQEINSLRDDFEHLSEILYDYLITANTKWNQFQEFYGKKVMISEWIEENQQLLSKSPEVILKECEGDQVNYSTKLYFINLVY